MNDVASAPEPTSRRSIVRAVLQLLFGIGLFAALVWYVAPPWSEIADTIAFSPAWLFVSFVGSFFATIVTAARWKALSEAMGASPMRYGVYFHYLALTRVIGQFLPSILVDVVGRGAALRAAGNRTALSHLIAPVVLERILDLLLPLVMLAWAIATHYAARVEPFTAWASLSIVVLVFAGLAGPLLRPLAGLALLALGKWRRFRHRDAELPAAPAVPRPLAAQVVGYSLMRQVGILVQYAGAGGGFGIVLPVLVLIASAPIAQVGGLVGLTPGGLGLQETGWAAGLLQLGQSNAALVVFVMATRVMYVVNFGLLTLLSWRWRSHVTD